jgi:hypothetical protein
VIIANTFKQIRSSSNFVRTLFPGIGRHSLIIGHLSHPPACSSIVWDGYLVKNNDLDRLFEGHEKFISIFQTPQREHKAPHMATSNQSGKLIVLL